MSVPNANSAPERIAFCPICGHSLITRLVGDRPRRACPACDYVHYTDPKVGVGALVVEDGKILLVKRIMAPERGKWSIPAGFLDQGEDPQRTAEREVLEETGLRVRVDELLDVYTNPLEQGGASIFILYRADLLDGVLRAGDDAADAAFFAVDELPDLAFTSTHAAIRALSR
jgi:8-oxo-dGTP diphosphatase